MLIIKDASGEIIGAQVEEPTDSDIVTYIAPTDPQHTLHRISDVPAEICDCAHPAEFQRLLTDHANSEHAQIAPTSTEEIRRLFMGR
ncbi:hypothetical protein [Streptosporangium sp. 'caverna']|uniref:hypothetical protein n=1 Tax=Streptosporangium sp. 'caverna' TaxID=2202249 RepID=UPI0013A6985F|nr:hypothetical protein [Streptosporangium sp. 'caverna']